jgi:hypothetical protein
MSIFSKLLKPAPRRIRVRTCDTLLDVEKPKFDGTELGMVWEGDLRPVGAAVAYLLGTMDRVKDAARKRKVAAAVIDALANYGTALATNKGTTGPDGVLTYGNSPYTRPEPEFSLRAAEFENAPNFGIGSEPCDVQQLQDDYWNPPRTTATGDSAPRAQPSLADSIKRYSRATTMPSQIDAIDEMNKAFYGS